MEILKGIKGYENKYFISNLGNVYSKKRRGCKGGKIKPNIDKDGYLRIQLGKYGKKFYVHRLVAEAFIKNDYNLPQINHKDEDKKNNNINNLEYCTYSYNINYGNRNKKVGQKLSKKVIGINKTNGNILILNKISDCVSIGFYPSRISACCKNKMKSYKKILLEVLLMSKNEFTIKVENNSPQVKSALKTAITKIYKMWGLYLTSKWTKYIDKEKLVDTGRFKNGVTFNSDSEKVVIGNPVSYASFLEKGTSRTRPRPTLRPAILDSKEELKKIAEKELKG